MIGGWLSGWLPGAKKHDLDKKTRTYAHLADLAYENPETRIKRASALGYRYDPELSHDRTAVFVNEEGAVVSYRGTQDLEDLISDIGVATNTDLVNRRLGQAVEEAQKVKAKYGKVAATGHSLGGYLADRASDATGLEATVFNPAASPLGLTQYGGRTRVIKNENDPLSRGRMPLSFNETLLQLALGAHNLDQFL